MEKHFDGVALWTMEIKVAAYMSSRHDQGVSISHRVFVANSDCEFVRVDDARLDSIAERTS